MRLGLAILLVGCSIPEGRFDCASGCPDGWFCHADDLCYSFPDQLVIDSGRGDAGRFDGGPFFDAGPDAGRFDGGPFDAGPPADRDAGRMLDAGRDAGRCIPSPDPELCNNGRDDDCNGLADCADPRCGAGQPCGASAPNGWKRCCHGACVDFHETLSPTSCSQCDFACAPGQACILRDNFPTCTCTAGDQCWPSTGSPFNCTSGACNCIAADYCGGGQDCIPSGSGSYCGFSE